MNAMVLVITALVLFALAYRFYFSFIAAKVLVLSDARPTPAGRLYDRQNYVPMNKWVLFGHHFAAIAGAGPLVGPVLAAQFGYFPGFLWMLIGAVMAGAVHDVVILTASVRHDGHSLAEIARREIGTVSGMVGLGGHPHHHHRGPGGAGQRRRQRPEREPLGHLHDCRHHPHRPLHGPVDVPVPQGPHQARPPSSASSC